MPRASTRHLNSLLSARGEDANCRWLEPVEGKSISGLNKKTLNNMDVDDCKKACEDTDTYKCMSFDYRTTTRTCWLQAVDRFSARLSTYTTYQYYERSCQGQWPPTGNPKKGSLVPRILLSMDI